MFFFNCEEKWWSVSELYSHLVFWIWVLYDMYYIVPLDINRIDLKSVCLESNSCFCSCSTYSKIIKIQINTDYGSSQLDDRDIFC